MGLDIFVPDQHDFPESSICLYLDEYDILMDQIKNRSEFEVMKKAFSDYYGEYQVYLNELDDLNKEAEYLDKLFQSHDSKALKEFINSFLKIIDFAQKNRKTIKFIGD